MTAWLIVVSLIVIGLLLINIEVIFVPGTTIVGLFGVAFAGAGVAYSFIKFDNGTGFITLGITLVFSLGSLIYFFKKKTWTKFALQDRNEGKVNEGLYRALRTGMVGVAISTLKPIGKAEFNEMQYEVRTMGDYIDENSKVVIAKIDSQRIYVEPLDEPQQ